MRRGYVFRVTREDGFPKVSRIADLFSPDYWRSALKGTSPKFLVASRGSLLLVTPRKLSLLFHLFSLEFAAVTWVAILVMVVVWYPGPWSPFLIATLPTLPLWMLLVHRWASLLISRRPHDSTPVRVLELGQGRVWMLMFVMTANEEVKLLVHGFRPSIIAALELAGQR